MNKSHRPSHARIVFFGDSITESGIEPNGYVTIIKRKFDLGEFDRKVEIIGAGISGNKVPDLIQRLERDVLRRNPTSVVIYIGINDVWHSQTGQGTSPSAFESGLREIIQRIVEAGAAVTLCTPSVIGERFDGSNELDAMLEEFSMISRKVAADTGSGLIDLRQKFLSHLEVHNSSNQECGVLTEDGVHLNNQGNEFVADVMLRSLELTISNESGLS